MLEAVELLGLVVEDEMVLVEERELVEVDSGELVVVLTTASSSSFKTDCFLGCSLTSPDFF